MKQVVVYERKDPEFKVAQIMLRSSRFCREIEEEVTLSTLKEVFVLGTAASKEPLRRIYHFVSKEQQLYIMPRDDYYSIFDDNSDLDEIIDAYLYGDESQEGRRQFI